MSIRYAQLLNSLIWLCLSSVCYASCEQNIVLDAAISEGYKPSDWPITCKAMPTSKQKIIVAYTQQIETHDYTLIVLIVDSENGKILSRFIDETPSFEGSGDPTELTIDTAPYFVAPNKRAFGVRVSYSLNSWDSTQHLNLYLVDGNKLKEILKGLTVGFSTTHACYSNAIGVVISISKFPTENFYDLVIATKERSIEGLEDYSNNGACTSSDPVINSTVKTIHFKDGAYDVYGK